MNKPIEIDSIWIEMDEFIYTETGVFDEDYCNVQVYFSDGSFVALNVWSEELFYQAIKDIEWIENQVADLPDLVVRKFDSESIKQAILNLEKKENWFRGRGYPIMPNDGE